MSEMIDRVARTIAEGAIRQNPMLTLCERDQNGAIGYFDDYDNKFYDCEALARAAIEAMREPTEEMLEQGPPEPYMDVQVWGKMIDAALGR